MQNRVSLGRRMTASIWTMFFGMAFMTLACSWITLTSISAHAADPNNILLDFSAKWCGPCQQMSPIVSKLERQGFPIRQVDVDQEKGLAQKYNVESIPCFVLIANGKEINRITGATDEKQLRRLMSLLPKQDLDEPMAGSSSNRKNDPNAQASVRPSGEKKGLLPLGQIFPKKKKDAPAVADEDPRSARGQSPESPAPAFAQEAMLASTRIRIKDGSFSHFGSGTIIESQPGRAVILTCGHILRNLGKNAVIEVDLFPEGTSNPQTTIAQVIKSDLVADIGLLSVACAQQLPVVRLAPCDLPKVRDRVFSIGCGGGKLPSVEQHSVAGINTIDGPDNLECTGVPLQGRSGGGLFLGQEQVGICIFADSKNGRGIYTSIKPIVQLLKSVGYEHLVHPANQERPVQESLADRGQTQPGHSTDDLNHDSAPPANEPPAGLMADAGQNAMPLQGNDLSAMAHELEGAEIVVTIHPKTPGGTTRVVIINRASSRILNDLLHETGGRTDPSATVRNASRKAGQGERPIHKSNVSPEAMAMQKPAIPRTKIAASDRPIETSFDAKR